MKTITIGISSIVKGGVCVAASDGQRVYTEIAKQVAAGNRVVLSFSGITRMTTAFLNAAVGQLYSEFTEEQVRARLAPPVDAEPWHLTRLKMVVDRAKIFFKDPKGATRAFNTATGRDRDEDL